MAPQSAGGQHWATGDLLTWIPRLPDTISSAVAKVKGKTVIIRTPGEFAKAINQVEEAGAADDLGEKER